MILLEGLASYRFGDKQQHPTLRSWMNPNDFYLYLWELLPLCLLERLPLFLQNMNFIEFQVLYERCYENHNDRLIFFQC